LCFVLPILSSNCLKTKKWGPPTKEPTSPTKTWHIFFIYQQKKKNYLSIKQKENKHLTRDLERERERERVHLVVSYNLVWIWGERSINWDVGDEEVQRKMRR
jgi:hypothetical protein